MKEEEGNIMKEEEGNIMKEEGTSVCKGVAGCVLILCIIPRYICFASDSLDLGIEPCICFASDSLDLGIEPCICFASDFLDLGIESCICFTSDSLFIVIQDSAKRAALLPSSPLSFAAEAGLNAYVKVRLPELMAQEERRTKTIALSFAPEFSHFFDICLPLVFQQDTIPHSTRICKVPLAEMLSSGIMYVEVWHEVQRRQLKGTLPDDKCFGRTLFAGSKDILLGCAELPLSQLLYRHSGQCLNQHHVYFSCPHCFFHPAIRCLWLVRALL